MSSPKVSVIIPVYNAGQRLHQCIDSILAQTLHDLEIICVLDCPTDGSDKVIEEYAKCDNRIKVVRNRQNLNIGESRNVGIRVATGEYLAFSDHDDIVQPYMYEEMYTKGIEYDSDIIVGVPEYSYPDPSHNRSYYYPCGGDVRELLLSCFIGREKGDSDEWNFFYSHGVIWDKIYRRRMVIDNKIKFVDNNIITFEDTLFSIECLIKANKAIVHNRVVYRHTIEATNTASTYGYWKPERVMNYIAYLHNVLENGNMIPRYLHNYANSSSRYLISIIMKSLLVKKDLIQTRFIVKKIKEYPNKKIILDNAELMTILRDVNTIYKKMAYVLFFFYLKYFI